MIGLAFCLDIRGCAWLESRVRHSTGSVGRRDVRTGTASSVRRIEGGSTKMPSLLPAVHRARWTALVAATALLTLEAPAARAACDPTICVATSATACTIGGGTYVIDNLCVLD